MGEKATINLLQKVTIDNSLQSSKQFGQNDLINHEKTLNGVIETYIHSFLKKHKWCMLVVLVLCRKEAFYCNSKIENHLNTIKKFVYS